MVSNIAVRFTVDVRWTLLRAALGLIAAGNWLLNRSFTVTVDGKR